MNADIKTIIDYAKKIIIKKNYIIVFLKNDKRSSLTLKKIIDTLESITNGLVLILEKDKKLNIINQASYPCDGVIAISEKKINWDELLKEKFVFLPSKITKLTKEQAFIYAHSLVEENKDFKISHQGEILNTKKFLYGE